MRPLALIAAILVAGLVPAQAFDAQAFDAPVEDVLAGLKRGKVLPIAATATLRRASERWCYLEKDGACAWSDIYLEVTDKGATYEIGNAWNADYDIVFTDKGEFRDGRFICEIDHDWLASVRAFARSDNAPIGGRDLFALKQDIHDMADPVGHDCFDYQLRGIDRQAGTIELLQRQYPFGGPDSDPAKDTLVTLHFDPADAAALTWYW